MSTASHAAAGIILTNFLIKHGVFPEALQNQLFLFAGITANLPDIDALLFKKIYDHRNHSPFHYPFTWWLIFMTALVISHFEANFLRPYIYLATANVFVHFLLDTLGVNAGICWFKPFHKKEYSFLPLRKQRPTNVKTWLGNYLSHPIMILEVILTVSGLYLSFQRRGL